MIGTTPIHTFTLPCSVEEIKTIRINYAQFGRVILSKKDEDVTREDNKVQTQLTQEDTFLFNCSHPVEIQVRGLYTSGLAFKSKIHTVTADRCLDREVLT